MRIGLCFAFVFGLALHAESPAPVILVDGWYPKCVTAPRNSTSTFGQLEAKLNSLGIATQYLRPCSVPATPGFPRASFEDLAQALGVLIDQTMQATKATQVDVIGFSTGSPVIRAYLSGKQNAPGVFQPPQEHRIRKAVFLGGLFFGAGNGRAPVSDNQEDAVDPGCRFLWDLNTWNQGGDDLRGIDAIAVAGQGQATLAGSTYPDGDGVHSLSSASLSFAYPAERTRIIKACHVSEVCSPTVSYVDSDSHPVWLIVKSFLTGTDEWKAIGSSPDKEAATYGGVVVGVKDASDNLIDASQISLSGRVMDRPEVVSPGLFYADQVAKGDYTLEAKTQALVPTASFSLTPGTYTVVTMKPGPLISAVVPSDSGKRQPVLPAGGAIEIRGTRLSTGGTKSAANPFPASLAGTQVTVNDHPIPLQSVAESQITAQLPAEISGFVRLKVITDEGTHAIDAFIENAGARPRIAESGLVNAASFVSGAVAPGEFVTIKGTNLGPANPAAAAGSQKGLGGTRVIFDGIEAFLTYSSATQVNALVPYAVSGKADVTVHYNSATSDVFPLAIAGAAPGIFTKNYGPGQAWALNDDNTFNSTGNPVGRGGWIVFWATGQGLVNPAGQDGETITTPKNVNLPVKVTIDGIEAPLIYAVLVYTGEIQVAARIPGSARTGDVPLLLTIGGASSRDDVTISVK